jgi:murein DD-endopeptidase MepM/ murein hydrolase activator NlpD
MSEEFSAAAQRESVAARRTVVLVAALICACLAAMAGREDGALVAPPMIMASADTVSEGASDSADASAMNSDVIASVGPDHPTGTRSAELSEAAGSNEALRVPDASEWKVVHVRRGETLAKVFGALDLPADDSTAVLAVGDAAKPLTHLHGNDVLRVLPGDDHVAELSYALDETHTLDIRRNADHYDATVLTANLEHRSATALVTIEDSLYIDGRKANVPERTLREVAQLFNYDVDFGQDLQSGDRVAIVYDQLFKDGKKLRDGDILAAEFDGNKGQTYRAVRYVGPDGRIAYYTPEGKALRTWFIRTPVDYTRISSGFSLHRWHPILHLMRAHKGVDYVAPKGTPVHAVGDGRVEFMGRKGGYGNVVILRHGGHYETVYGHLSRFGRDLRPGAPVYQGEVIAYVGMTGLATAPHLHYEFRVDGIPRNPVTVALPRALPLAPNELAGFHAAAQPLVAELSDISRRQYADASQPHKTNFAR